MRMKDICSIKKEAVERIRVIAFKTLSVILKTNFNKFIKSLLMIKP